MRAGVNFDPDGKLREFIDKALVESDPVKQAEMYKEALRESGARIRCHHSVLPEPKFHLNKNARGELFKWEMPVATPSSRGMPERTATNRYRFISRNEPKRLPPGALSRSTLH